MCVLLPFTFLQWFLINCFTVTTCISTLGGCSVNTDDCGMVQFASTVSDGLGTLSMDDSHNRTREELRSVQSGRSADHLVAGIKGFGIGLLGGVTSIASQTIKGTRDEGFGVRWWMWAFCYFIIPSCTSFGFFVVSLQESVTGIGIFRLSLEFWLFEGPRDHSWYMSKFDEKILPTNRVVHIVWGKAGDGTWTWYIRKNFCLFFWE